MERLLLGETVPSPLRISPASGCHSVGRCVANTPACVAPLFPPQRDYLQRDSPVHIVQVLPVFPMHVACLSFLPTSAARLPGARQPRTGTPCMSCRHRCSPANPPCLRSATTWSATAPTRSCTTTWPERAPIQVPSQVGSSLTTWPERPAFGPCGLGGLQIQAPARAPAGCGSSTAHPQLLAYVSAHGGIVTCSCRLPASTGSVACAAQSVAAAGCPSVRPTRQATTAQPPIP